MGRPASVAEHLREILDTLTPTERRAATTLLAHYPMVGLQSLRQFARRAGVSGATIVRLLAKLRFAGYPDFQEALRNELAAQLQSPLWRWEERRQGEGRPPGAGAPDFLAGFAAQVIENLRETFAHMPRPAFDRVVGLLANEKRPVHVLGGRFTARLAGYFFVHLRAVRPEVREIGGQAATWPDQLLDIGRHDTVLVFDIRRYQPDVASFAEAAAARGAAVVLLTDEWHSPIAAVADHVILTHTASAHGFDSQASLLAVVEALIAAVCDRLGPRFAARMRDLEELRRVRWGAPVPEAE